jgi:hypothetical protein
MARAFLLQIVVARIVVQQNVVAWAFRFASDLNSEGVHLSGVRPSLSSEFGLAPLSSNIRTTLSLQSAAASDNGVLPSLSLVSIPAPLSTSIRAILNVRS